MRYLLTGMDWRADASLRWGAAVARALLARRGAQLHLPVPQRDEAAVRVAIARWGLSPAARRRLHLLPAGRAQARLGLSRQVLLPLQGGIDHVFHLAVQTPEAEPGAIAAADIDDAAAGPEVARLRSLLGLLRTLRAGHLHLVLPLPSAAGLPAAVRAEEAVLRHEASLPWTLYRSAAADAPALDAAVQRLLHLAHAEPRAGGSHDLDPPAAASGARGGAGSNGTAAQTLRDAVAGRVVLVTGGSSGIGLAASARLAAAGAITVIAARDPDRLSAAAAELRELARAHGERKPRVQAEVVDVADPDSCAALVERLTQRHGGVDVLINNAGRSIRRAIENSYDRFHDLERTMQLNYFGALRLTLGLLPGMVSRGHGHVINISSIGVLVNAPRFSAYVASKAALDAWTRCAASEFADRGVAFTTVNMPLVRTPMIAPTRIYDHLPLLAPEEAAELVVRACIERPERVATRLGVLGAVVHALAPRAAQTLMNKAFRIFPDSAAARGVHPQEPREQQLSAEASALAQLLRGVHV